jgi:hypothetical protein
MLMAPALLFGAAEATTKLLTKKEESKGSWMSDFQAQKFKNDDDNIILLVSSSLLL